MKVTGKVFNEGTRLVFKLFIHSHVVKKDKRADVGGTFDLLSSMNLDQKRGCTLIKACTLNRSKTVLVLNCVVSVEFFLIKQFYS